MVIRFIGHAVTEAVIIVSFGSLLAVITVYPARRWIRSRRKARRRREMANLTPAQIAVRFAEIERAEQETAWESPEGGEAA